MIIDRQGKLFGLINIIDLGVIVILLVIGVVFLNLARNARLGEPLIIEVKVLFADVPAEVVKVMQPGDREEKQGQTKLRRFETLSAQGQGQADRDIHAWISFPVRVKDVPVGNRGDKAASYFYRGEELNLNDPFNFKTANYFLQGTILNIGLMDSEIEVILNDGFPAEIIEMIKPGDKASRWQHLTGEVLAKELTSAGRIKVKLHIKRGEVNLKPGEQFAFETEHYYVWGTIVQSNPWSSD